MSLRIAIVVIVLGVSRVASAQMSTQEQNRFFVDKADDDEDSTLWQGSLMETSFIDREAAGISDPLTGGAIGIENAAPLRWFTELRAQLDARHIAGKTWDARFDGRARLVNALPNPDPTAHAPTAQSGTFGGNEYDLRELYVVRGTEHTDLALGRQIILDVAGMKIDGLSLDYAKSRRWTYLGFAGLYPQRGSRSITTDYPHGVTNSGMPEAKRIMPVAGGIGAAYRTVTTYGAIGIAGIAPLADDKATKTLEQPRLFVSSNGYWRQSSALDLYHYAVVDITGASGFALTNLSAGLNWRPQMRLHVEAQYNRVDTETLNVQAQTELDTPDTRNVGVIQNNVTVARIASDSARASVSAAFGRTMRWEVTTAFAARQRPDITLNPVGANGTPQTIGAARSGELFLGAVDRDFYGHLRLAGSYVRIFGIGNNAARSDTSIVTVSAAKQIGDDGRGEWSAQLAYLANQDENRGVCSTADLTTCYGQSSVATITASGTGFYRLAKSWLLLGVVEIADESLTVLDGATSKKQPGIVSTTALAQVSYRF